MLSSHHRLFLPSSCEVRFKLPAVHLSFSLFILTMRKRTIFQVGNCSWRIGQQAYVKGCEVFSVENKTHKNTNTQFFKYGMATVHVLNHKGNYYIYDTLLLLYVKKYIFFNKADILKILPELTTYCLTHCGSLTSTGRFAWSGLKAQVLPVDATFCS